MLMKTKNSVVEIKDVVVNHELEAAVRSCSSKKLFLKISQFSLGNTGVGLSY